MVNELNANGYLMTSDFNMPQIPSNVFWPINHPACYNKNKKSMKLKLPHKLTKIMLFNEDNVYLLEGNFTK